MAFSAKLAAVATSTAAAATAAAVAMSGGSPRIDPAWTGESDEAVKKRLAGSLLLFKDSTFGYIPVTSGAGILRTKKATDADPTPEPELKVSKTGSETGSFFKSADLATLVQSWWPAVATVDGQAGQQASLLNVGGVTTRLRPVVSTALDSVVTVTQAGDSPPVAMADAATAFGHEVGDWQPWAGRALVPGTATPRAGLPAMATILGSTAPPSKLWSAGGAAGLGMMLGVIGINADAQNDGSTGRRPDAGGGQLGMHAAHCPSETGGAGSSQCCFEVSHCCGTGTGGGPGQATGAGPGSSGTEGRRIGDRMPIGDIVAWAERLGIAEPLVRVAGESDFMWQRRQGTHTRALASLDVGKTRTMVGWAADYVAANPTRQPLFKPLEWVGDVRTGQYNLETMDGFADFIRASGSRQRGKRVLAADTIQGIVASMRILREVSIRAPVAHEALLAQCGRSYKIMRREDVLSGASGAHIGRETRRAFRASHFRRLDQLGWDRFTATGEMEWAAMLTAHNALLRGGEVGRREGYAFHHATCLSLRSITWCSPCADSGWRSWLMLWVVPIKDGQARRHAEPIPIVRRQWGGATGADPLCTYDALSAVWRRRVGSAPVSASADWQGRVGGGRLAVDHPLAAQPLFLLADGSAMSTREVRTLTQRMAFACGENPAEFGAKSARAGGATDLRAALGDESKGIVKQRGRWQSDIHHIYERALLRSQLDGSAAMGTAEGADMEAVCLGWSQPAAYR